MAMTILGPAGEPVMGWRVKCGKRGNGRYALKPLGAVYAELPETTNITRTDSDDGGRAAFVESIKERYASHSF